jgi:hypothetical protein
MKVLLAGDPHCGHGGAASGRLKYLNSKRLRIRFVIATLLIRHPKLLF